MDEFWVCAHCKSLNRAGQGRCYHCKQGYGSKPKEVGVISRAGATPPVALPGGLSAPEGGPGEPQYRSRPVAVPPPSTPGMSFSEQYRTVAVEAEKAKQFHLPSPLAPIGRRFSGWLATRQTVSVRWLGYLTAGLLTLLLIVGVLLVATISPSAMSALQTTSPGDALANLDAGRLTSIATLGIAFGVLCLLSLTCFSVFMGLSTHNAPGLGAAAPGLTPYQAGTCWFGVLRAQVLLALGLLVPAVLFWYGYAPLGAIAAIVFLEMGQRRLDDPLGWLTKPTHLLTNLYARLGIQNSSGSPIAFAWSVCFRVANILWVIVWSLLLLGVIIVAISAVIERPEIRGWQTSGLGPSQMAVALVIGSAVAFLAASIGLLVPVTIELVERQRARKTLVRVGRAQPWADRPAPVVQRGPERGGLYDPYGAAEDDDQASLYSPSTTPSSPPWSVRDDGPPD